MALHFGHFDCEIPKALRSNLIFFYFEALQPPDYLNIKIGKFLRCIAYLFSIATA